MYMQRKRYSKSFIYTWETDTDMSFFCLTLRLSKKISCFDKSLFVHIYCCGFAVQKGLCDFRVLGKAVVMDLL